MALDNRVYHFGDELWREDPSKEVLELQQKYVDDMKPKERTKIKELRDRVNDVLQPKHNDFYLVKWLRARNFDLNASESMLRTHLQWRKEERVDTIIDEYKMPEVVSVYGVTRPVCEDIEGCPVWMFPAGHWDFKGLFKSCKMSDLVKYFIHNMEMNDRIQTRQTHKYNRNISKLVAIADLENFRLMEFLYRPTLELLIQHLKIFEAQYPETLKKAIIFNAPKVFQVFFSIVKPFISEATKTKIVIYGQDGWKEALFELIDPAELPKHWGGTLLDEGDGNPYCSSRVGKFGPVAKSFFTSLSTQDLENNGLKKVTVGKKAWYTVDVNVEKANSTLTWLYQTETHDVGFGICFNNGSKQTEVVPVERVYCQMVPVEGTLLCEKPGMYTLKFDNTYSWYRSKTLYYEVRVVDPEQAD